MQTKRQKQVLDIIKTYKKKKGYAPSLEEIKNRMGLSSVSTVHHHIKRLQESGYLQKGYNQPRSVAPMHAVESVKIPLLGTITAGQPLEAIEVPSETISITKDEVSKIGKCYALSVVGSSMVDEGIYDGDIVIIREQKTADNGQTVVAIINNNEATLKKIYKEEGRIRLQPANPELFPIYTNDVEIRGVVIKIIRNLELPSIKEGARDKKFKRQIDYSWDFKGEMTKSFTHGLHSYPAMFIPQVARRLLQTYSKEGDTICDIFCGSGTALVESRLLGRNSYGIDLNPLAIFLAKVKTTQIDPSLLSKSYFKLMKQINKIKGSSVPKPIFLNIDFWFKKNVIVQLAKIKRAILNISNKNIRNFFLAAFSETVRSVSNTKNGEFKLVRINKDKLENYNPNVFGIFSKKVELNINGMKQFYENVNNTTWAKPILGDSSQAGLIPASSIDYIITSPPYGDSRTTVAYGQFSRLSSQWIDLFSEPNRASGVDNELLGGRAVKNLKHNLNSRYLTTSLNKIAKKDTNRARDVLSFYIGLEKCLRNAYSFLKPNKYFCLLIGNRLVKQVRIPTDFIIAELCEHIGFSTEDIIVRNIPGKRMPSKTSPTNIAGKIEDTMSKESIVILKKIK